jgi:hypothetical protein
LQPLSFDALKLENGAQVEFFAPEPDGGFQCGLTSSPSLAVRSSGLGWDYSFWDSTGKGADVWRLSVRGRWLEFTSHGAGHRHLLFDPKGTGMFTGIESRALDGNGSRSGTFLPTLDPQWNISIPRFMQNFGRETKSWQVMNGTNTRLGRYLPQLTEMEPVDSTSYGKVQDGLTFDQRWHWSAEAELLVTIPPGNKELVLRRLPIPDGPPQRERGTASSRPVESTPSASSKPVEPTTSLPTNDSQPNANDELMMLAREEVATPMPAPTFKPQTIPFASPAIAVCQGGGGRYLVIKLKNRDTIVVDLAVGRVIKTIAREPNEMNDFLPASGLTKLVLLNRSTGEWCRWDFANLDALPTTGQYEQKGRIHSVAMGCASEGPIAVSGAIRGVPRIPDGVRFVDLEFKPLRLTPGAVRRQRAVESPDGTCLLPTSRPIADMWASAAGNIFASPDFEMFVRLHPDALERVREDNQRYKFALSHDGKLLFTGEGIFGVESRNRLQTGACLPTAMSRYALKFPKHENNKPLPTGGEVIDLHTNQPVLKLPAMEEMASAWNYIPEMPAHHFDCHYFYVPQLGCLATIPRENDRLVIREAKLDPKLLQSVKILAAVPVAAEPMPPAKQEPLLRTWADATGKFQVEATLLSVDEELVRLKRKDGKEIAIPLKQLSKADQVYLEIQQRNRESKR